jgi:CheY-like chemotaxis protein
MNLSTKKRILIVEDSPDILILLKHLLKSENFEVCHSSNGEEALKFLQNSKHLPNLILLDLMMPVMDGYGFRKAQMQDERLASIPVIIMTADVNFDPSHTKTKLLKKPFEMKAVLDLAHQACG